jgi:hypothetical protein
MDTTSLFDAGLAETVVSEIDRLVAALGRPKADASVNIMRRAGPNKVFLMVYPDGIGVGETKFFDAPTVAEAFANAHIWAASHNQQRLDTLVRRLAMAIIDLTDATGEATAEMLAERDFRPGEIAEFHEFASARASSMAGNRPFAVQF